MHQGSSEERILSANSSPRMQHKHSSNTLFGGLWPKRSTKVEPHPLNHQSPSASPTHHHHDQQLVQLNATTTTTTTTNSTSLSSSPQQHHHDLTFAKCSPDKKPIPTISSSIQVANCINNNPTTTTTTQHFSAKVKSQTLPPSNNVVNNNLEKSLSSGFIGLQRRINPSKSKAHPHRHSTDGSQSDGGEVVLRKSPKHRSPNHNRFSHQFSLCCKVDRKPMSPPVTVRYNSIPYADAPTKAPAAKRDNLSLSWSVNADNTSLSLQSSDAISAPGGLMVSPPQAMVVVEQHNTAALIHACSSAPQSPVTSKTMFTLPQNSTHSSPSNSSVKSTQSERPSDTHSNVTGGGPIRPIAVTACRSRLRLKLLPPGKEMPRHLPQYEKMPQPVEANVRKATTPQHMSSPNIATNPLEMSNEQADVGVRFMSQENIQIQRQSVAGSTQGSGLARQALMAAQVLSLIPTEKARERSFLVGRLGPSSLMGPAELNRILPTKEITIFVGTWNMNGQNPPKQLNDFVLPNTVEHVPDIVAIGTQESSPDRFEWEATIQETLGPSHVLFHAATLGTLHLAIYTRRDLIWYCSAPEDSSMSVRTGSAFRTKGAVAISFCLFGTSMLFVTSHLTAHQQKVKERVSDVKRIINALDLPKNLHMRYKNKDVTQNFDNVFWCGDLNFRLGEPREKLLDWIQHTKFPLPSHLPHGYMHTDQLSSVLADGAAFRGFMEANITFPPTYKYDPGTQHFDTSSKQRAPAYTDRILYKCRTAQGFNSPRQSSAAGAAAAPPTPLQAECLLYDSVPSITTSDHKPVLALFRVGIRAGTDSIPLAAGLFNREIYLEGIKRRLNNQYSDSSAVCSIQ